MMRAALLAFVISLVVWGLIALWNEIRVYELLLTWQRLAIDAAIVSGLVFGNNQSTSGPMMREVLLALKLSEEA